MHNLVYAALILALSVIVTPVISNKYISIKDCPYLMKSLASISDEAMRLYNLR